MAHNPSSVVNFWDYEGQSFTVNSMNSEPVPSTSTQSKPEMIKFYQKPGLQQSRAKPVGIIQANGDMDSKPIKQTREVKAQLFTLPFVNATNITMSPLKMEPAILPKTVHLSSAPVILGSPQRIVANVINNSRPAQQLLSAGDTSLPWTGKRPNDIVDEYGDSKRVKKGEKGGKGLRHFSMKVCEKVRKKGTTSYNEVADELVAEFSDPHRHMCPTDQAYDQKNIRRRVYDALNVLMAMNIISKEKKEIKWLGLPTNCAQEYQNLEREKHRRVEKIRLKTQHLQDLILQQIAFKNLISRNRSVEAWMRCIPNNKIQLPFFLLNTHKETSIECSISGDNRRAYKFGFSEAFQINDETEIMKRMGLVCNLDKGQNTPEELELARSLVPRVLLPYVNSMSQGRIDLPPGMVERKLGDDVEFYGTLSSEFHEEASSSSGPGTENADIENTKPTLSRQSSVGSLSDLPSRHGTSTPSDGFSECDSDSMDDSN